MKVTTLTAVPCYENTVMDTITNPDEGGAASTSTTEEVSYRSGQEPEQELQVPTGLLIDLDGENAPGSTNTTSTDAFSADISQTPDASATLQDGLGSDDEQVDDIPSDSETERDENVGMLDLTFSPISLFDDLSHWMLPEDLSGDDTRGASADMPAPRRSTSNEGQMEDNAVFSPTRTLFPFTEQRQVPERRAPSSDNVTRAKMAELRLRNRELEQKCADQEKRISELLNKNKELEERNRELEKSAENHSELLDLF
jgi:hypothetical protein